MKVYAESSAILAWILGEGSAPSVVETLAEAGAVFASELTVIEVDRGLDRSARDARLTPRQLSEARSVLNKAIAVWTIVEIRGEIVERARRPFPQEPIRTLDAIHLASALAIRETVGPVSLLTLDARVRRSAYELGFPCVPAMGDSIHEPG